MMDPRFTVNPVLEFLSRIFSFGAWFDLFLHIIF